MGRSLVLKLIVQHALSMIFRCSWVANCRYILLLLQL